MVLYLIRHAEPYKIKSEKRKLTQLGQYQSKKLGERFVDIPIHQVICSDLERCVQTLNYSLTDNVESTIITASVREIDRRIIGYPCYESINETNLRKEKADLKKIVQTMENYIDSKENILVFSHGNLISYIAGHFLKLDISERWRLMIWHSSVTKIVSGKEDSLIEYINSTSHLKETEFSRDPVF